MSEALDKLKKGNEAWAAEIEKQNPGFFEELSKGQSPEFLWIGCADSRVPVNQLTGSMPGSVFVHRNIANMVVHSDTNLLSVVYYAVKALKVKHIVICGHYGCGGAKAAMGNDSYGPLDNWLAHIKDVYRFHKTELEAISDEDKKFNRFVELNVQEQVNNMGAISFIQEEWKNGEFPKIHGLVYDLKTGKLVDLNMKVEGKSDLDAVFQYK